jgi:NAD(P)-dependent dehydrogenase (short-subunit alcohol dehydrogenase family)
VTLYKDSVALVTGGGSGIGRALSLELAGRGAIVHVTDINPESAQRVARECGSLATAACLDVCDGGAVSQCVEELADQHSRIDFIFNNAGIGVSGETFEIPLAAWERVVDINIRGVIHGVHAAYPIMVKQGHGHIVNTASAAGLMPVPLLTPYAMSKHAVVGLSRSLRAEAAPYGVHVNVLCPTAIDTPLLDAEQIEGLDKMPWKPDFRRYLSSMAGPPYPAHKLATEALDAISRNEGIIVIPKMGRFKAIMGALFPGKVEEQTGDAAIAERKFRTHT